MKFKSILAAFILAIGTNALAAQTPIPDSNTIFKNYLVNPGFENFTYGWTASGGATKTSNTTAKGEGNYGYDWDSNSASQTLQSSAITIPAGLYGKNGLAYCKIKTPSGTATHTITVNDGTNDLVTAQTLSTSSSTFAMQAVNFIFPTSGTIKLKLTSVASNEPEIYIDSCYLGEAANLTQASQAQAYGTIKYAAATSCLWGMSTSTSFQNFSADTDCSTPSVTGFAAAPGTKIPALTFTNLPPGEYEVQVAGGFDGTTAGNYAVWTVSDGTTTNGTMVQLAGSDESPSNVIGHFIYTSTQSSITFQPQCKRDAGSVECKINNDAAGTPPTDGFYIRVYRFPSVTETVVRPELINWHVDANITAATNPSLGVGDDTSWTDININNMSLANNTGNGVATAWIACETGNSPTGSTCSGGINESAGISFILPQAGDILACASFTHFFTTAASGKVRVTFGLHYTADNATTSLADGHTHVSSGNETASLTGFRHPLRVCGIFNFTSAGRKTLRLMEMQDNTATVTTNTLDIAGDSAVGSQNMHWEVYPINQGLAAPIYVGSVTSNSTGQERIERANITCSSSSAVNSQSGSWLTSVGNVSSGKCVVTLAQSFASTAYECFFTRNGTAVNSGSWVSINNKATGSFDMYMANISSGSSTISAGTNESFDLACMGPK